MIQCMTDRNPLDAGSENFSTEEAQAAAPDDAADRAKIHHDDGPMR